MKKMKKAIAGFYSDKRVWFLLILSVVVAFVSVTISSTSTSFLYPTTGWDSINIDSHFFLYAGSLMTKGYRPYIDFYDHKGLYHLGINALAYLMGGRYPLYFLELIYASATLFFIYKSVQLLDDRPFTLVCSSITYLALVSLAGGGNCEGEWLVPFVAVSFFYLLKYIVENNRKSALISTFFAGLQVSLAFNSRPADGMLGAIFAILYLIVAIKNGDGAKSILANVAVAIGAFLIPYAFIVPFAIRDGYCELMFRTIFLDNLHYVGSSQEPILTLVNRIAIAVLAVLACVVFAFDIKRERGILPIVFFVIYMFLSGCYFVIARYSTYYYASFPVFIVLINRAFGLIKAKGQLPYKAWSGFALTTYLAIYATLMVGYYTSKPTLGYGFSYGDAKVLEHNVKLIPEKDRHTKGKVYAINCQASVYLVGEIDAGFPYFSNQSWWEKSSINVKDKVNDYLSGADRPTWLLVAKTAETVEDFGQAIELNYTPFDDPDFIENPLFGIYCAK